MDTYCANTLMTCSLQIPGYSLNAYMPKGPPRKITARLRRSAIQMWLTSEQANKAATKRMNLFFLLPYFSAMIGKREKGPSFLPPTLTP